MYIDLTLTLLPTCKYLRLYPTREDAPHIKTLIWCLKEDDDTTPEEALEYIRDIIGIGESPLDYRLFRAECKKNNFCCVLTESVVISVETPISILIANKDRLINCDEREVIPTFPKKSLMSWVLDSLELE